MSPSVPRLRHALVTGGAGFIGHHLAAALLGRGLQVTILDDLSMGRRENVPPGARLVIGDVRDPVALDDALADVDCVFHEAALVSVRASVDGFLRDADVNFMGTLRLLESLRGRSVRKAVFASSMAVYADASTPEPLSESALTVPISPYGVAKLAAERAFHLVCAQAGIESTVLRYFNTYGPNQTPTPYVGVITIFIRALLAGRMPVVFGDGEQRRDFVHVDDIVAANLAVLEGRAPQRTFNVGTGRATSVNEVAAGLIAILAPGGVPDRAPAQPGEMRNAIAGTDAIRHTLGWTPRYPSIDYARVIDWWKARLG